LEGLKLLLKDFLYYHSNKEKFNKLNELLLLKAKETKEKTEKRLINICLNEYNTEDMILAERKKLILIQNLIDKLEYSSEWLLQIDLQDICDSLFFCNRKGQQEFKDKLLEIFV
jgi:hypothetical protein